MQVSRSIKCLPQHLFFLQSTRFLEASFDLKVSIQDTTLTLEGKESNISMAYDKIQSLEFESKQFDLSSISQEMQQNISRNSKVCFNNNVGFALSKAELRMAQLAINEFKTDVPQETILSEQPEYDWVPAIHPETTSALWSKLPMSRILTTKNFETEEHEKRIEKHSVTKSFTQTSIGDSFFLPVVLNTFSKHELPKFLHKFEPNSLHSIHVLKKQSKGAYFHQLLFNAKLSNLPGITRVKALYNDSLEFVEANAHQIVAQIDSVGSKTLHTDILVPLSLPMDIMLKLKFQKVFFSGFNLHCGEIKGLDLISSSRICLFKDNLNHEFTTNLSNSYSSFEQIKSLF